MLALAALEQAAVAEFAESPEEEVPARRKIAVSARALLFEFRSSSLAIYLASLNLLRRFR